MLSVQIWSKSDRHSKGNTDVIQAVADIENKVQPYDAWSYKTLYELLEQDSMQLIVVSQSQKIIGYCLYQVIFEQAEILRIGTHPDYQRQGVASQLFSKLHQHLQKLTIESLMLEVRADNLLAIKLYQQQNFNVIHQRSGYYKTPNGNAVDALIMQRLYE